jgi:hypothetical protein
VVNTFALGYQALGVNPANLGRRGESRVPSPLGRQVWGAASQSLSRSLLQKIVKSDGEPLSSADKVELLSAFCR